MFFSHDGAADTWDDNSSGHDIKFGIYRSLNNRGDLRDEQVRFADFCASKTSAADCDDGSAPPAPDGGAGTPDAGAPVDAGAGGGPPTPTPPATPDAASPPTPTDPGPTPTPTPQPPTGPAPTPGPTGTPPRRQPSGGCTVGGDAAAGTALPLVIGALVVLRRRRRRA
jgi:MYXO-CTERM domain-containing protein